jgi:hypothetical protein
MRLYRRCQRCDGQVDENEQGYGPQRCLSVLDAAVDDNKRDASELLERTLAAGWYERGLRMTRAAQLFDQAEKDPLVLQVHPLLLLFVSFLVASVVFFFFFFFLLF